MATNMLERSNISGYNTHGGYFMSPEDQKELKGQVLVEYQEVEDQINALEAQAEGLGNDFVAFGNMMQRQCAQQVFRANQAHHNVPVGGYVSDKIQRTLREWEKCFDIADRLRQAYARLQQLKDQKMRLGLR